MLLRLQAIQFNHDSRSATADAFNIRKNDQELVEVPEWRRGKLKPEHSPAAYARAETRGNTLTIKASFSFEGVGNQDLLIRALDANFHPESQEPISGSNLSPEEVKLLKDLTPNERGNVLGVVKATPLTLSPGETGFQLFELESVRIWDAGVSADNIVWRWQYLLSGTTDWLDLAVTTHRIYVTLHVPTLPWDATDHAAGNTQLPWLEVLEHACDWARNSQNTDDAAERITCRVNDLGREKVLCYGPTSYTDVESFDCSSLLALLRGELGNGNTVDCDDCAAIVSTFANILGCDLRQMCIKASGKSKFGLKPHLRIGMRKFVEDGAFNHHTVAAEGGCSEDVEVFDACLQILSDSSTQSKGFTLPTNLAFSMRESGYHFRLVAAKDQPITHPADCKRRRLGPLTSFNETCADRTLLEKDFEFSLWKESSAQGNRFFASEFFLAEYILSSLEPAALQKSQPRATPTFIYSLWRSNLHREGKIFRIDAYETASWQDAREGLMKILAALEEPTLVRQQIEGLGDITFADFAFENILFAAGNLVFYLKNVGEKVGPLIDVGRHITEKILNPPPGEIEELVSPDVKRFSFTSSSGAINNNIRLCEEPPHLLQPQRLYQFVSDDGEVSREPEGLVYRPRVSGDHKLQIFAVDMEGNAVLQTLPLKVGSSA